MRRQKFFIVLLILLTMLYATANVAPAQSQEQPPLLGVIKFTEKDEVRVGEEFTVFIEIKNFGNSTAYNITLEDYYPDWEFEVLEHGGTNWDKLDPNETVITFFKLKIENYVTNLYSLGKAKVIYYDSLGNRYVAYSEEVWVKVVYYGANPVNIENIWKNTGVWVGLLVLSIVAPLLLLEFLFYRSYQREIQEKKKK